MEVASPPPPLSPPLSPPSPLSALCVGGEVGV